MQKPFRNIAKEKKQEFLQRAITPAFAVLYVLTSILLPYADQVLYTRVRDAHAQDILLEEPDALLAEEDVNEQDEMATEDETPAEEEVSTEELPDEETAEEGESEEEETVAEEPPTEEEVTETTGEETIAVDGEGDELDEAHEADLQQQLLDMGYFECVEIETPAEEEISTEELTEEETAAEEPLTEEEVTETTEEEVSTEETPAEEEISTEELPDEETAEEGESEEEETAAEEPLTEEEVTETAEKEISTEETPVEETAEEPTKEIPEYEEAEVELDGRLFRCKRLVTAEEEGAEELTETEEEFEPDNDEEAFLAGTLIREVAQVGDEVARIKLADIEISDRDFGDEVSTQGAIEALLALTTTEQDLEQALIRALLKKQSTKIAETILSDKPTEDLIRANAKKGLLQTLKGKVSETLNDKIVRQKLAAGLEDDPEIEEVLELMMTEDLKKELLTRIIEVRFSNRVIDIDEELADLIENDFNKFVLEDLLSIKLIEVQEMLDILLQGVSLERDETIIPLAREPIPFITVTVSGAGGTIQIPMKDLRFEEESIIMIIDPVRQFRPGLYQARVDINNPITKRTERINQEFTWGVLAINTDRDIYQPGDLAKFGIGVLDDRGRPVCDAQVEFSIETPTGSVRYPKVINTGTCNTFDSLNTKADYRVEYTMADVGEYKVKVSTVLTNGKKRSMTYRIKVARSPDYVISRRAATRLYPIGAAPMSIDVYFYRDFNGFISDIVPASFDISNIESAGTAVSTIGEVSLSQDGRTKLITWNVKAEAGNSQSFRYFYNAPDASPQFFTVGPLNSSGDLLEKKQWQIVNNKPAPVRVTKDGLASYWKFDTGAGTTAYDDSVYRLEGDLYSLMPSSWSTDIPEGIREDTYSMEFDGIAGYIRVEDPEEDILDFADGTNFTIAGWISCNTDTGRQAILSKRYNLTPQQPGYALVRNETGHLQFTASDGSNTYNVTADDSHLCQKEEGWNHFAVVWKDAKGAELYMNGNLHSGIEEGTTSEIGALMNTEPLVFGATANGENNFDGKLDEIHIYNRALTQDEISALWTANGPGGVVSDLELWLKTDEGLIASGDSVTAWIDQSRNGNDFLQAVTETRPGVVSEGVNSYDTVRFDGNSQYLENEAFRWKPVTVYGVLKNAEKESADQTFFGQRSDLEGEGDATYLKSNTASGNIQAAFNFDGDFYYAAVPRMDNKFYLYKSEMIDGEESNAVSLRINGSDPISYSDFSGDFAEVESAVIGAGYYNDEVTQFFDGELAELLLFVDEVTTKNADQKIQSYLALKYGITLDQSAENGGQDYLASSGKTIWAQDENDAFEHNIAGIGLDHTSGFEQLTAKSQEADAILRIADPDSIDDYDYLIWADNKGAPTWTAENAPEGYKLLSRQWQAQETNDLGLVDLEFDLNNENFVIPAPEVGETYYFVYDSDNDGSLVNETPVPLYDDESNGDDIAEDNKWTTQLYFDGEKGDADGKIEFTLASEPDTTEPTITLTDIRSDSPYLYYSEGTLYYVNDAAEPSDFTIQVTADDPETDVAKIIGSLAFDDTPENYRAPYTLNYSIEQNSICPESKLAVTAVAGSGLTATTEIDCVLDGDGPIDGSIDYTDGFQDTTAIDISVNPGTDAISGMSTDPADYLLEYKSAPMTQGACGEFGEWTDAGIDGSPDTTSYSFESKNAYCYQFRYTTKDQLSNETEFTSASIIMIDTLSPVLNSITINDGDETTKSPAVTLTLSATNGIPGVTVMQLSCNYQKWSTAEPFMTERTFDLTRFPGAGCNTSEGEKTVYVRLSNLDGTFGDVVSDSIIYSKAKKPTPPKLTGRKNAKLWGKGNLYEDFTPELELTEFRDGYAKHFRLPDGAIAAYISSAPIHYEDNGQWKEIIDDFEPNISGEHTDYEYATVSNKVKRFNPKSAGSKGKLADLGTKGTYKSWIDPELQWLDANGNTISRVNASNVDGVADANRMIYSEVFNDTDVVFTQGTVITQMDIVLKSEAALADRPAEATHLAYCEDVIIPNDWTYKLTPEPGSPDMMTGVLFRDGEGQEVLSYPRPEIYEDNGTATVIVGEYSIKKKGRGLNVCKIAPVDWLTASDREFPVVVDPTEYLGGAYQTATTYWSGTVGSGGEKWNSDVDIGCWSAGSCPTDTVWRRGFAYFPTNTIMDGSVLDTANDSYVRVRNYSLSAAMTVYANPLENSSPLSASGSTIYSDCSDETYFDTFSVDLQDYYHYWCLKGTCPTSSGDNSNGSPYYSSGETTLESSISVGGNNWFGVCWRRSTATSTNHLLRFAQYGNATTSYRPMMLVAYLTPTISVTVTSSYFGGGGYYYINNGYSATVSGSQEIGSGTCYAYWDTNQTYAGTETPWSSLGTDCSGYLSLDTSCTNGTIYYICILATDDNGAQANYACDTIRCDSTAPLTPSITCGSFTSGVWGSYASPTCTWDYSTSMSPPYGYYCMDTSSCTPTTYDADWSVATGAGEGTTYFCARNWDLGGYGSSTCFTILRDQTNPTATSTTENVANDYVTEGTYVTITSDATDATSGIDTCYAYWDDNTGYTGGETNLGNLGTDCDGYVTVPNSTNGTWYFCVRPVDQAENWLYSCTNAITYDETAPTIGAPEIYTGTYYGNYFRGLIDVRSAISDALSGLASDTCQRNTDGGGWTTTNTTQDANYCYAGTFSLGSDFTHQFRVQDNAGNWGTSSITTFIYENSYPTCTISSISESSNYIYANGTTAIYYNNSVATPGSFTINVTATDSQSGIGYVDGSTEFGDTPSDSTSAYALTYSIEQSSTCSSPITVTAHDNVILTTIDTIDCSLDITGPTVGITEDDADDIVSGGQSIGFSSSISDSGAGADDGCDLYLDADTTYGGGNYITTASPCNGSTNIPTGLDDGSYYFCAYVADHVDNYTYDCTGPLIYDDDLPTVTFSFGSYYYNSTTWSSSSISGTASDGSGSGIDYIELTIEEDNTSYYWNGSGWQAGSTTVTATGTTSWSYDLPYANFTTGYTYTVSAVAHDNYGRTSSPPVSDTMYWDDTAPSVSISSVSESSNYIYDSGSTLYYKNDVTTPGSFTLNVSATDNESGITNVSGSTEFGDTPSDTSSPYTLDYSIEQSSTCTSPITVTATNGVGGTNDTTRTCTLDNTAPTGGSTTYTNGYQTTTGITVNVNRGSDSDSGLSTTDSDYWLRFGLAELSGGSCGAYDWADAGVTETASATNYSFTGTTGECYMFSYRVRDRVLNEVTNVGTDVVMIDTQAPTSNSISINSGASYTNSASATLTLSSTDTTSGVDQMQFSCDDTNWTTPETYGTSQSFNITSQSGAGCTTAEGTKTVYARFKDTAGNWTASVSDTITYDISNPTTSADNSSSSWVTTSPTITLSTSDTGGSGLDYSKYSWDTNDSTCRSSGTSFNDTDTITIPSDGDHTLYLCNTDNATNTGSWNGPYRLDSTAPTISSTTEDDTNNVVTSSDSVTITSDGADATSGIDTCIAYWDNDTTYAFGDTSLGDLGTDCDGGVTIPDSTDGTWYICVRPLDLVGYSNYDCTNALTYDETDPVATGFAAAPDTSHSLDSGAGSVDASWTDITESNLSLASSYVKLEDALSTLIENKTLTSTEITNKSYAFDSGTDDNTWYLATLYLEDDAGLNNSYTSKVITSDRTSPATPILSVTADNTYNKIDTDVDDNDSNLVGYWAFEEGAGSTTTEDWSSNDNTGTITGAVYAGSDTDLGDSLSFNGSTDYVSGASAFSSVTNTFTMMFWANPDATRSSTTESTSGAAGTFGQRYAIWPEEGNSTYGLGHAGAGVSVGTNGISVFEQSGSDMPSLLVYDTTISGWTHIAVVYDNKKPKLYINGELVRASMLTSSKTVHPGHHFGEDGTGYGYYSGFLDEVRIYDAALTESQIIDAMQSGLPEKAIYHSTSEAGTYTEMVGFKDDFLNGTNGASPTTQGWTVVDAGDSSSDFDPQIQSDGSVSFPLRNLTAKATDYIQYSLPVALNKAKIEFDAYVPNSATSWNIRFQTNNGIYLANNGSLAWREYISPIWHTVASSVTENTWHTVMLLMDVDTGAVQYFVDGVLQNTFNSNNLLNTSDLSWIRFYDYGYSTGTAYLRNIKVTPIYDDDAVPDDVTISGDGGHGTSWSSDNTVNYTWGTAADNGTTAYFKAESEDAEGNTSSQTSAQNATVTTGILGYEVACPTASGEPVDGGLLADEDMEETGTGSWTANNAVLSKETGSPHGGSQVLRITQNGSTYFNAYQTVLTTGNTYRIHGWARGDGTAIPAITTSTDYSVWYGANSTSWQEFDQVIVAQPNTTLYLRGRYGTPDSYYVEFDDVLVTEIQTSGTSYECTFEDGSTNYFYTRAWDDAYHSSSGWDSMGPYNIDTTEPDITSITSVAGDTSAPYYDSTDDSSTSIVFVSADDGAGVYACRWNAFDATYAFMTHVCASTTNCVINLSGEGSKTVYLRCTDALDNPMTSSETVTYEILLAPTVTDANISISGATGTGGAYKTGDTVTVTWDNSASGDNNTETLTSVTADLSGWDGSSTATMTDTTACGGTADDDIYEACYTLTYGSIDNTNVNATVTAANASSSSGAVSDSSNATVDNQIPLISDNGTITITTDNGITGVAAVNNGFDNQDKVTQSAVTMTVSDGDIVTVDIQLLTGQSDLLTGTESSVVVPGVLDSPIESFLLTAVDNAGNVGYAYTDTLAVDNTLPTVTTSAISVTGATGNGGIFVSGDTATGRWDDSATGDGNIDTISSVSFDLSDFRTGDGAVSGSESSDIWTGSITGAITDSESANNNVTVTVTDNAGNITTTVGTNNYEIDQVDPSGTSLTPTSTRITDNSYPSFTADDGNDEGSGINTGSRVLERSEATYSNNICGSYGSYSSVTISGTYPNVSDNTASGSKCYKYRWKVEDNAGNSTTSSETAEIVRVPLTTITITGGNNQSYGDSANNPIGYTLPVALQVRVTDGGTNWALADEVTVDFAFNTVPGSPTATGQSLGSASDNTDASGYASTTLTFGDRAGDYTVDATSTHSSITVEPTFTETAGQYFSLDITEPSLTLNLNATGTAADAVSPTVTVSTNAASYNINVTPDQWPTNASLDEFANWSSPTGYGWRLNAGSVTAWSTSTGDPAATTVYTCSGDSCQGTNMSIDIDLYGGVNYSQPAGAYTNTNTFSGVSISY